MSEEKEIPKEEVEKFLKMFMTETLQSAKGLHLILQKNAVVLEQKKIEKMREVEAIDRELKPLQRKIELLVQLIQSIQKAENDGN